MLQMLGFLLKTVTCCPVFGYRFICTGTSSLRLAQFLEYRSVQWSAGQACRETGVGVALIGEGALAKPILWWSRCGQPLLCQHRDFCQRLELAPCPVPAHGRLTAMRARKQAFLLHEPLEVAVLAAQAGALLECHSAFIGWVHHAAHGVVRVDVRALGRGLEARPPAREMVTVCPAAAQEYFAHEMDERLKRWNSSSGQPRQAVLLDCIY